MTLAGLDAPRGLRMESTVLHIAGLALLFVAAGMVVSAGVDLVRGGDAQGALLVPAAITATAGLAAWRLCVVPTHIPPRSVFAAVTWSWVAMSVAGASPFLASGLLPTVDDALFESFSGFTCTGSTVLTPEQFEDASPGVLWWRQLTQWFGGMGIIVLAVAVLPFLGVGGLELVQAEAPGPTSDRLAPRVSETAKRLWLVYVGFTLVSIVGLLLVGMDWFDASAHALTLVSTGGFSPEVDSIGAFDSFAVELVIIAGMIYGGTSFSLHYQALRGGPVRYVRNSEFRVYLVGIGVGTVAVAAILFDSGFSLGASVRNGLFNVVTLATSTGYGNAQGPASPGNFVLWAAAAQVILFVFMWSGAMTGSTSGGMKVMRVQVMGRIAWREMARVRRLRAIRPIRQGSETIGAGVASRIAGFVLLYFLICASATVVLTFLGADPVTALSGTVGSMGNMGPALGDAGPTSNFLVFTRPARMVLALLMLVGRLEVFPILLVGLTGLRRVRHLRRPRPGPISPRRGTAPGSGSRIRSGSRAG